MAVAAALLMASEPGSAWATFERQVSGGIGWQMWTTHAVHVSLLHLLGSGLVWWIAGAAVERISRGSLVGLLVIGRRRAR